MHGLGVAGPLLAGLLLAAAVPAGPAVAGACNPAWNPDYVDISPCQRIVQPPLTFGGLHTHWIVLDCPSTCGSFFGAQLEVYNNFSWDNQCFSVAEDAAAEDGAGLAAAVTNWCLDKKVITITLGCTC